MTWVFASSICCMMVAPKFASVWNSITYIDVALQEALRVLQRGRAVQMVVGHHQIDPGGGGVRLDARLDLDAERDVLGEVGERDHQLLAVARRRRLGRIRRHRLAADRRSASRRRISPDRNHGNRRPGPASRHEHRRAREQRRSHKPAPGPVMPECHVHRLSPRVLRRAVNAASSQAKLDWPIIHETAR